MTLRHDRGRSGRGDHGQIGLLAAPATPSPGEWRRAQREAVREIREAVREAVRDVDHDAQYVVREVRARADARGARGHGWTWSDSDYERAERRREQAERRREDAERRRERIEARRDEAAQSRDARAFRSVGPTDDPCTDHATATAATPARCAIRGCRRRSARSPWTPRPTAASASRRGIRPTCSCGRSSAPRRRRRRGQGAARQRAGHGGRSQRLGRGSASAPTAAGATAGR